MQNFSESIKTFRKSADLTQTQFADRLGVHLQTISKWERGLLVPDFSLLGEIASVLSIPLEDLLGMPQSEKTFTGSFDMASFGKALSEARKGKNESQSELASAVNTSADNISKWERGVTCPDVSVFVLLAEHLEVPASKLYFGICDETEVELPAQWRRRKKLHLLWLTCAVVPLLIVITVLTVLLIRAPRATVKTQFDIDYWLCGGSFRTEVPYTIREEDGEVTLAIPQKEGSEFLGWYLTPDYSGDAVTSITCKGEDVSLYAKWDTLSFDVRYELFGGILSRDNPVLVTAETSLPLNAPARRGYLFLGWFDSPEGGLQYERVGGAGAKNLTLYAVWQKCDVKFSVTYELDGGVLKKENPLWLEAGAICSLNTPEKRGFEFLGWNKTVDASGEFLTEIYGISEDLTLYAIYSPKIYLVQYRYEGAYEGEQFNPNRITFGQSVSLLPVTLYGNEFLGWFTEEEGGTKIEKIDESNLPELSVLYAHFRPISFSVFLDAGGGEFEIDGERFSRYTLSAQYGQPQELPIPTRADSIFIGWVDEMGNRVEKIDIYNFDDISLTAKWRSAELRYQIRYELAGGIQNDANPTEGISGERVYLYAPQKTGYLFLGWFDNEEGQGTRYDFIPEDREQDIVLYAIWQEIKTEQDTKFAVHYELGGGTLTKKNPDFVGAGESYSLNSPEKRGYDFVGWNKNADGSGEYVETLHGIAEDLTLYAIYTPRTYLVRYEYEGYYTGAGINPNRIKFGERVELLPVEQYGSDFLGWYNKETGGEKIDVLDESNLPETPVLYARFEPWRYSIKLDANGGSFLMNGAMVSAFTLDLYYGVTYVLPLPQLDDYIFVGWETEDGERVEKIEPQNIRSMTLKAHWRPAELRYQIRYELAGGIQNDANPTEGISGERVYLYAPQKTGYLFLGWFDNEEGQGTRYDFIPEDREQDIVLFAIWQEIKTVGSADYFTYEKGANAVKITGYTGPSGDNVDLAFPAVIDGLPVTEISEQTMPATRLFHSVTIPHSVTIFGTYVFCRCIVTEPLMIPSEVERIEAYSFCDFQGKIRFPEHGNLIYIGECAFSNCTFDEPLILPQGVETIGTQAFSNICADGVFLPDSVKTIADKAFWSYDRWVHDEMTDIFLPSSPIYIGREAFQLINLYTTLTAEQTKNFDPNWSLYAHKYTAEKHKVTLLDGGYTETFEDYGIILPKRKKEGFTFLGWQNGAGEIVHNCYFPSADETLVAVYEEETPTDGRVKDRATPLTAGQNYRLPYVSLQSVYFVWEGDDCTLQFSLQRDVSAYLIRGGVETKINGTCVCKKGDLFRVGGHWAQAGTTLTLTVTVT